MTTAVILIGWYAMGLLGVFLLHRDWQRFEARHDGIVKLCPTPAQILGGVFGAMTGVIVFCVGAIVFLSSRDSLPRDCWWHRRICDR